MNRLKMIPKGVIISVLSVLILAVTLVTIELKSNDLHVTEGNNKQEDALITINTEQPDKETNLTEKETTSITEETDTTEQDQSKSESKETTAASNETDTKTKSNNTTTTGTSNNTNTNETTTTETEETTDTNNSTETETLQVKSLFANGKLVAKGHKIELTRDPFKILVYENADGNWKQTGGMQGEFSKTMTFTVKDENGNIIDTPSKPADYGTIQTLTFTPGVVGEGTIQQSRPLTYKALVLNDGSGHLVVERTGYVDFTAIPAEGWEFKEWKVAIYKETDAKLTYGFSVTQKVTGGSNYITATFVKKAETTEQ